MVGWCDGPGVTSSAGASCNLGALAVGAGGGCLDIFFSPLSFLLFLLLSGRRPDID